MITVDEAYSIIVELNEEAHSLSWDTWVAADELEDSDNEDNWSKAERMREEASEEQAGYFREEFDELDNSVKSAIMHYVETDESFGEEFKMWYGTFEFEEDFGEGFDEDIQ